ncbi:MAG: M14 family zinc carboxypeptidase [Candidatus Pacearchaeota archaeon]
MNKKGLNKIISIIILSFVFSILGILIIYSIIAIFTKKGKEETKLEPILIDLDIQSAYINKNNDTAIISVTRTGEGQINKLKFIFNDKNGVSYIYEYPYAEGFPKEDEKKIYEIKSYFIPGLKDFSKIITVSIAFTVLTESGNELTSIIKDTFGKPPEDIRDPKNNLSRNTPIVVGSGSSGTSGGDASFIECVPNCLGKECGNDGCGGICPPGCSSNEICNNGKCSLFLSNNLKDMNKYDSKELFLVSDNDWKKVLPYIPLSVWSGNENCQRGTNTPKNVCVYPMLIYHGENDFNIPNTPSYEISDSVYSLFGKSLVRIYLDNNSIKDFLKNDLDIVSIKDSYIDVVISDSQRRYYENKGYHLEILPVTLPKFNNFGNDANFSAYHTYESMVNELNSIQQNYSSIAKVYVIGKSIQGRNIYGVKISDNVGIKENETRILITGNHHAREIISVEVPMYMINYLTKNYYLNEKIKKIVDNYEFWFVPMVNPDGHIMVEKGNLWWRKNLRDNNNNNVVDDYDGVDLNRNYGYTWGYDDIGSSPNFYSETYRGTKAFSEPETYAIYNLSIQNNFSYVFDYHSYGGFIIYPWGHINSLTPDDSLFYNLSNNFKVYLKGYNSGTICQIFGYSNGDSIDWHYGDQTNKSKSIAFGIELDSSNFIPPSSEILPICKKNLAMLLNFTGYNVPIVKDANVDIDSVIYFMQQYSPNRLTILGDTSQEIDNLLIASPPVGAGLNISKIRRISEDNYLNYWLNYSDIIYVEDNYEIALVASSYASLINSPLIIKGSNLDKNQTFNGKNVICIGNISGESSKYCSIKYDLKTLQDVYLNLTKTKKIILVNPDDWDISLSGNLKTMRTAGIVRNLYTKNSLIAPILAASKHELILTNASNNLLVYDKLIEDFFNSNYNETITECKYIDSCSSGFDNKSLNMKGVKEKITFFIKTLPDIFPYYIIPYEGKVNKKTELKIGVKNIGFNVSKNCSVRLYLVNDSKELILIGMQNLGDINENEVKEAVINLTFEKAGYKKLYINVSTDSKELDEENNFEFFSFEVKEPSPDVEITGPAYLYMKINSANYFNISIFNNGEIQTGKFNLSLMYYNNSIIYEKEILNLNPGENKSVQFEFNPKEIKTYYLIVYAQVTNDYYLKDNYHSIKIFVTSSFEDNSINNNDTFFYKNISVNEKTKNNYKVYENKSIFDYIEQPYYYIYLNGFFYNCSKDFVIVNIYFNNEPLGYKKVSCYNDLPRNNYSEYLGGYPHYFLRNITFEFNGSLIFHNESNMMYFYKDSELLLSFSKEESSGVLNIPILISGWTLNESSFYVQNKNYSTIIVNIKELDIYNKTDFDVYLNGQFIGLLDLRNSNGDKSKEFLIPENLKKSSYLNISLKPNGSNFYIANVKLKTDFDDYYLTIIGSPESIPNEQYYEDYYSYYESDFRELGDIDKDNEGEFSVGRIFGLSSSDVSSYLARVLFYDKITKKSGGTFMMVGDGYTQRIPLMECNKSFCSCYFDVECPQIFNRYKNYFYPFENCNQDLIDGKAQDYGTSDCENVNRLKNNILFNSSMTAYAGHAGLEGWDIDYRMMKTNELIEIPPMFNYAFGCASCSFREASYYSSYYPGSLENLFCANIIRKGSIGYQGAVENMYGNHFLNEIFDEILINNKSIGYAFKVAKNKERRYDWETPLLPNYAQYRDLFGIHDTLIGDPTFIGKFGK